SALLLASNIGALRVIDIGAHHDVAGGKIQVVEAVWPVKAAVAVAERLDLGDQAVDHGLHRLAALADDQIVATVGALGIDLTLDVDASRSAIRLALAAVTAEVGDERHGLPVLVAAGSLIQKIWCDKTDHQNVWLDSQA